MNTNKFLIKGMHCESCKALVTMELEDAGLAAKIKTLTLLPEEQGELEMTELTADEMEQLKIAVSKAGYSVM